MQMVNAVPLEEAPLQGAVLEGLVPTPNRVWAAILVLDPRENRGPILLRDGTSQMDGDTVNISTGWVTKTVTDLSLPVRGDLPFGVWRYYDEGYTNSTTSGLQCGDGWRLSPNRRLFNLEVWDEQQQQQVATTDLLFRDGDGALIPFFQSSEDDIYYSKYSHGVYAYIEEPIGAESLLHNTSGWRGSCSSTAMAISPVWRIATAIT